jgi:hypothetical protein
MILYICLTNHAVGTALNIPPPRTLFTGMSELETLITSRAVFSTISEQVKNEIISDSPLLRDVSHGYFRLDFDICYLALIGLALYSKMDTSIGITQTNQKLNQISRYSSAMKLTRAFLFTLFVIVGKNVENAI